MFACEHREQTGPQVAPILSPSGPRGTHANPPSPPSPIRVPETTHGVRLQDTTHHPLVPWGSPKSVPGSPGPRSVALFILRVIPPRTQACDMNYSEQPGEAAGSQCVLESPWYLLKGLEPSNSASLPWTIPSMWGLNLKMQSRGHQSSLSVRSSKPQ